MGERLVWTIVVAVVGVVGSVVVWNLASEDTDDVDDIKAGQCVAENRSAARDEVPYRVVPCGDAAAAFVVLRQFPTDTGRDVCPAEPGTSRWFSIGDRTTCLGRKDVDPATAINVAKQGDCVAMDASLEEPLRLDCADPRAKLRVLRRLTDATRFNAHERYCEVIAGASTNYGWTWIYDDNFLRTANELSFDVFLCLGSKDVPVPSTIASEPASNCSYLDATAMAAVLTRAAGRAYTVASTEDRKVECGYTLAGGGIVYVTFGRPTSSTPPSVSGTFTVDGLLAHYGGKWLMVYTHSNRFFRAIVRLDGVDDALTKAVAIEVFRAARPRLV